MHFLRSHPAFVNSPEGAIEYYFRSGRESANMFRTIVEKDLGLNGSKSVLEFASGYGCVTRHLLQTGRSNLVSCDIHAEANDFIATEMGVTAMESSPIPEEFSTGGRRFDLVFALSFFSHMPKATWTRWLKALFNVLAPGGHLIFTTHGQISLRKHFTNVALDEDGFYFHPDSEQKDLDANQYGTTITDNRFVIGQIATLPRNCELLLLRAGLWWDAPGSLRGNRAALKPHDHRPIRSGGVRQNRTFRGLHLRGCRPSYALAPCPFVPQMTFFTRS